MQIKINNMKYITIDNYQDLLNLKEYNDIQQITFGPGFNGEIEPNVLPKSLTHLKFGNSYRQKFEPNVLPNSLTQLTFGYCYDQYIESDAIPKSLTYLTFG